MALLHDYLKQQQSENDVWTIREQLCLASAVVKNGDQNWVAVSRTCRALTSETNRPADWYSTKNCAFQYAKLLEKINTPKRKREKGESNTNEKPEETVAKILSKQRMEELSKNVEDQKESYEKLLSHITLLESGHYDNNIDEIWDKAIEEQQKIENEEKQEEEWLKLRGEKMLETQKPSKYPLPIGDIDQKEQLPEMNSTDMQISIEPPNAPSEILSVDNLEATIKVEQFDNDQSEGKVDETQEPVDCQEETAENQPPMNEKEVVSEPHYIKDNLMEPQPEETEMDVQKDNEIEFDVSKTVEVAAITDELPNSPVDHSLPESMDDTSKSHDIKIGSKVTELKSPPLERNADDIYAFDSDPESSDKKLPSFSLSRDSKDESKRTEKYETWAKKRKRISKDNQHAMQQDDTDKHEVHTSTGPSVRTIKDDIDDCANFELPKKVRRIRKDDEDEGKKKIISKDDIDEDDVSRDSAEVKEILMFVKSDRRRVYGHDDTASPVISESTPSSPASTYYGEDSEIEKVYKTWKKSIILVWNDIAAHKNASVFLRPITEDKVPGYHSIVYKPTDLQTIKRQIETGVIRTTQEFQRDVLMLFLNAKMYNPKDHNVFLLAHEMMKDSLTTVEEYHNAQLLTKSVDSTHKSFLRQTRDSSSKRSDVGIKRKRK